METTQSPTVRQLAEEFHILTSHGIRRKRLKERQAILNLPVVQARAGSDQSQDNLARVAEAIIRDSVDEFDEPERRAFTILLVLGKRGRWRIPKSVVDRRAEARNFLGDQTDAKTWKDEVEIEFFEQLAEAILDLPTEPTRIVEPLSKR